MRKTILLLLLVSILGAEELNPQIPDKLIAKYWKARADLAVALQEIVSFCHGDVGMNGDVLVCITQPVPVPAPKEDKK